MSDYYFCRYSVLTMLTFDACIPTLIRDDTFTVNMLDPQFFSPIKAVKIAWIYGNRLHTVKGCDNDNDYDCIHTIFMVINSGYHSVVLQQRAFLCIRVCRRSPLWDIRSHTMCETHYCQVPPPTTETLMDS